MWGPSGRGHGAGSRDPRYGAAWRSGGSWERRFGDHAHHQGHSHLGWGQSTPKMPPHRPPLPPQLPPAGSSSPKGHWRRGWGRSPLTAPSPQRLQVGDIAGTMRLPWALLCLWLLAGAAGAARARTRRELAPGLYEHGVYDAGGSYCQRGDVCCHGRDDGCTVPYLDTICYCDLFCNRTVSDCCPDFWEYCLGIPAPFPKVQGEGCPSPNPPPSWWGWHGCPMCWVALR